ncbi:MAG: trypsin-like peptidase domain-containing protein [Nitrososphaerales archaeon]|nr:trypsin-like peptidase domain-containing protein [Nitrososphaerales archaeon]
MYVARCGFAVPAGFSISSPERFSLKQTAYVLSARNSFLQVPLGEKTRRSMKLRSGVARNYWGFLVIAVVLSSLVTYSTVSIMAAPASTAGTQQLQSLVNALQAQNSQLQSQLASFRLEKNITTFGINPIAIYAQDSASVVTVEGVQVGVFGNSSILGSGFVTDFRGTHYVVTNFHVVQNVSDLTVAFSNGDAYLAKVIGTDPYSDLAVLSVTAPSSEFRPLQIVRSSTLSVGQAVVAIGNPFGLSGSMTFGIISQLGRTISESLAGNFPIANVIQFSAPINPGNSGGPLLSANGTVVGMTTATVQSSQGLGFAIPSDTILKELPSLVLTGSYQMHAYLGVSTADMSYQLAQLQGTNVTYGALVESVVPGSPADKAGLKAGSNTVSVNGNQYVIGGDIIIAVNGTKIVNTDALSSYLQEFALPGQTGVFQIIRSGQVITLNLVYGARPPASG